MAFAAGLVAALTAVAAFALLREPDSAQWRLGLPAVGQIAKASDELTGPPTRLRIPAIGIDAALGPLQMDQSGELQAPADYSLPGWYEDGTTPGETGPAVIAGHLDSQKGQAIFYRLHELRPDDLILVQRDGKWITFEVVSTGMFAKNKFPTAKVYGPTPDAQLRVITCGGSFDPVRKSYRDNVVVFAVAAG
jgi:sortase (surface protein transpeptidase)